MTHALRRLLVVWVCVCCCSFAAARGPVAQALPGRHPAQIEDLLALHELGGVLDSYLALSPDGRQLALFDTTMDVNANTYAYHLVVIDLATHVHRTIADAGDIILASIHGRRSGAPVDRRPIWSPDGKWLYYLANAEGRAEIWRADAAGHARAPVVQSPGDVRDFALTSDGRALVFETLTPRVVLAAQRADEDRNGFRVDANLDALYSLRPLPDEARRSAVSRMDLQTHVVTSASAAERVLLQASPEHGAFIKALNPAASVDAPALGVFDTSVAPAVQCRAAECSGALEQSWLGQGQAARTIIFQRREGHARFVNALYAWTPATGEVRLIRRSLDRLEGCVATGASLVCLQDFTTQPRRLVRIDIANGDLSVLFDPNPQWRSIILPHIERLEHTDAAGNESFAHVVFPQGYQPGRRYPAVVVQYKSRGFLNAGTGGETPILPLSTAGFFVLSVDRPEFYDLAEHMSYYQMLRQTELDDSEHAVKREAIAAFIATLEARGLIDSHRLGITGMSDGAETVYDMLVADKLFSAAVVSHAPTDPMREEFNPRAFRDLLHSAIGATPPWDDSAPAWTRWRERNATAEHADRIDTPLLMNLADTDALAAFPLLNRLQFQGTPVEAFIYPGAYHIKWRPSQIAIVQQRSMDWLSFWLQGRDPADADEAARWRKLRTAALVHDRSAAAAAP